MSTAWSEALFASWLQPSDAPTADTVAAAISRTVRQFGSQGCAGRMAQEFGDHPDAAAERMRWVRRFAAAAVLGAGLAEADQDRPGEHDGGISPFFEEVS